MIVEDEPITALDLSEKLSKSGFYVIDKVSSGEKALEIVSNEKPDIILMDIKLLGELDGIETAARIKNEYNIPTVFLTAFPENDLLQRAKKAEPYGYIIKPYDERELVSALEMALFRHNADNEIRRLNRLYLFISQVNQTIVRVKSEEELFKKICDIAVNLGGYKLAWIGLIEEATKRVRAVAYSGDAAGYLEELEINLDDEISGKGLTASAIKNKKPNIIHNYLKEEQLKPWWDLASKKGFKAAAAFPLFIHDDVCGALMLYSADEDCFTESEVKLLEEVTSDISFALTGFNESRKRKIAETDLERIFTLTPDILIILHNDGIIKEVNPAWTNILGWKREESVNKSLVNFAQKNQAGQFSEIIKKLCRGISTPVIEFPFVTSSGNIRILSWNFLPAGEESLIYGVARDITDKALAEKRIRELNNIYSSLVENMQQAVFQKDTSGKYIFANRRFCEMVELPLNEIIGKSDSEIFIIQPIAEKYQSGDEKVIETGETFDCVEQISLPDGKTQHIRIIKTAVKNENGKTEKIQGIIWDITKEVETSELLRLQSAALEASERAILITDKNRKIIWANKAVEKISQYSPSELIGKDIFMLKSDFHDESFYQNIRETIYAGKIWSGEIVNKKKNGELYTVDVSIIPFIGKDGKVENLVIIQKDISFSKHIELQVRRLSRLESARTLMAGIAHDLNNALTPIAMAVSLLKEEYTSPTAATLYDMISESVERIASVVKSILLATRGIKNVIEPLDVTELIQMVYDLLSPTLPDNIKIKFEFNKNLWLVNGDSSGLQLSLKNIIINAIEAMPDGGTIRIAVENFESNEEFHRRYISAKPGKYVKIEIIDTGKGISPKNLERVFDPFFTTKEFGQGFGLGLTMAQSIIKSHDGIIDIESALNKGTTVRIYLPALEVK